MKGIVLMYFLSETDTTKRVKRFRKKVTGQCLFYSIKKIILNLFGGCTGVEDSRNIVGLKLWADENGYGKMYYRRYLYEKWGFN